MNLRMSTFVVLFALLLVTVPSCRKAEDGKQEAAKTAEKTAVAPTGNAVTKPGEEDKLVQGEKNCLANADDPDGLYQDFFDCRTPFPMKDGKAAKYDKSWKQGDNGALMNGYEFSEITQEFIDDYKKALEAAGYINGRPIEAPPIYQKKISETSELRVELTDTLCKEWMNDCDDSKKTGKLLVQTAIMTFDAPVEPEPANPAQDAEKIKAAYNHPADPDKLYAGLPSYCIFPVKDGKAFQYASKNDLLDGTAGRESDLITYTFVSTPSLDIDEFIRNTFVEQLKAAGFIVSDGDGSFSRDTNGDNCTVEWDSGEGELNLRFYIRHIEDSL